MAERKKLSDILLNSERERLDRLELRPKPADDLKPIPERRVSMQHRQRRAFQRQERALPATSSRSSVLEGEHAGRRRLA